MLWVHLGYFRQVLGYCAQNIASKISENGLAHVLGAFGILLTSSGLLCAEHNVENFNTCSCIFSGCIWDTFDKFWATVRRT